jgi:LuxR family transcriptional regulator, quorum-sensing system regulator BjaR1
MLSRIVVHAEKVLRAETPEDASEQLFAAVSPFGASYLQTRLYRRPDARLTSASHFAAGGFIRRIAREDWPGSAAFNYVCFDCNPLLTAIRENRTRYRFSDFAPRDERRFGTYWEACSETAIGDALCATSYGAGGWIASLHLGFADPNIPADDARAIQLAGLVLTERLLDFASPSDADANPLTERERDALALVADGKTDWEISVILGVSESTARFHVDNARRKLGAVNRSQAVARLANRRLV